MTYIATSLSDGDDILKLANLPIVSDLKIPPLYSSHIYAAGSFLLQCNTRGSEAMKG